MTCQGTSLDSCLGHSAPTSTGGGQYHYHGNINCTQAGAATGAADPDTCKLIGYYRDGVPVYGFCKDTNGGEITIGVEVVFTVPRRRGVHLLLQAELRGGHQQRGDRVGHLHPPRLQL